MSKVYQIVTERIIEQLEAGTVPWRKPWTEKGAVSWERQRPYRGVNALLLEPGEYATFNTIKKYGGQVKKGQKGQVAVFWKWTRIKDDPDDPEEEGKIVPFCRYYTVFEINTQATGLESRRPDVEEYEHEPLEEAELIAQGYDGPPVHHREGRAYYNPPGDYISLPELKDFQNPEEYYSTLFHEMVHSTGHTSRLNRNGVAEKAAAFGSETYSKEELVAEIGAAMLCGVARIETDNSQENSAAYIASWLERLRNDSKLIVHAAGQAQKAADYIRGITWTE